MIAGAAMKKILSFFILSLVFCFNGYGMGGNLVDLLHKRAIGHKVDMYDYCFNLCLSKIFTLNMAAETIAEDIERINNLEASLIDMHIQELIHLDSQDSTAFDISCFMPFSPAELDVIASDSHDAAGDRPYWTKLIRLKDYKDLYSLAIKTCQLWLLQLSKRIAIKSEDADTLEPLRLLLAMQTIFSELLESPYHYVPKNFREILEFIHNKAHRHSPLMMHKMFRFNLCLFFASPSVVALLTPDFINKILTGSTIFSYVEHIDGSLLSCVKLDAALDVYTYILFNNTAQELLLYMPFLTAMQDHIYANFYHEASHFVLLKYLDFLSVYAEKIKSLNIPNLLSSLKRIKTKLQQPGRLEAAHSLLERLNLLIEFFTSAPVSYENNKKRSLGNDAINDAINLDESAIVPGVKKTKDNDGLPHVVVDYIETVLPANELQPVEQDARQNQALSSVPSYFQNCVIS